MHYLKSCKSTGEFPYCRPKSKSRGTFARPVIGEAVKVLNSTGCGYQAFHTAQATLNDLNNDLSNMFTGPQVVESSRSLGKSENTVDNVFKCHLIGTHYSIQLF